VTQTPADVAGSPRQTAEEVKTAMGFGAPTDERSSSTKDHLQRYVAQSAHADIVSSLADAVCRSAQGHSPPHGGPIDFSAGMLNVQSRFRPNICGLGAFVVARGSRLLPHLASDEACNDPGIDLFTSFAVVHAKRLDYRPLPV
jgi:hypothetical protein